MLNGLYVRKILQADTASVRERGRLARRVAARARGRARRRPEPVLRDASRYTRRRSCQVGQTYVQHQHVSSALQEAGVICTAV